MLDSAKQDLAVETSGMGLRSSIRFSRVQKVFNNRK